MTKDAPNGLDPPSERKLDLAARAAWLYYVKGRRQDQIAADLNLSRPVVQRLIALATSENLIRLQLIHPLAECIELAERLRERFDLVHCEIAPSRAGVEEDVATIAATAAIYLENFLSQKAPVTIGVGNGSTMREIVSRIAPMARPQHKCVSLMGNLTRQGRAAPHDVVMRLAERVGAQCYPLPMPVVTNTVADREVLQAQIAYSFYLSLVEEASVVMMGIGHIGWKAPLHVDGFITDVELAQAMEAGAVGEVLGQCIDETGVMIGSGYHNRLTSFRLPIPAVRPTVIVQTGKIRVPAIKAALDGRIANALITDEHTAHLILD
ncbi:sugar-binding transcriptional regulator [Methylocapsa sp. S129]|uniref:sugar-binding transcriptional regulator n=1 Tax=Methylocapsa sp. S129 TaxID=1641869 RepID=UPI00131EAE36|nr:sugar-binding domain-containing protein [Methylocapsa sp. S129]